MKTIMIAVLLVGCLVLAAADDDSKDTPTFPSKSCTDSSNGEIYPNGYSGPVIGLCQQITCKDGQLQQLGCPTVFDANKNIVPETSGLPYPDCCPSLNPGNK